MSKILLLSPFFTPEPISTGRYNGFLAQALVAGGDEVIVACSHPLYPDWVPHVTRETPSGIRVFRGGGWLRYPNSALLRRLVLESWFLCHAMIASLRFRKELKTVVAIFPPSLFFLMTHLLLPRRVRRVGIVHDLQGVLGLSGRSLVTRLLNRLVFQVEKAVFSSCDRLILLSEGMREHVLETYRIDPARCSVRYPFLTETDNPETTVTSLSASFPDAYKHVVYSGALGDKQSPEDLMRVFQELVAQRSDVMCHIFSRGPLFKRLKTLLGAQERDRICLHDLVDERYLPELFARSSIQIIPQKTGTSTGAFPSKLPNLLAAGVPVFAITDPGSELASLLEMSGIGECYYTWDYKEISYRLAAFIDRMSAQSHPERIAATREFVRKHFHIDALVADVVSV